MQMPVLQTDQGALEVASEEMKILIGLVVIVLFLGVPLWIITYPWPTKRHK